MDRSDELKQTAQNFIRQLNAGEFVEAASLFDEPMAKALPEARLKETWADVIRLFGAFQEILSSEVKEREGSPLVTVTSRFERMGLAFHLTFDRTGRMSGLTYTFAESNAPYHPPAYAHPETFHEVDVTVGGGEWALPGTLSMPNGAGPFAAVVLVHGSGPNDRDETIGPNRPFRDLAWGLASHGIAVLRYEKRTKAYGKKFTPEQVAAITVKEETVDDALAAIHLLRQTQGIDPARVFVLGHSLGGMMAPRIGQQDPSLAGLIILGGLTRSLEDTMLDQYTYLYGLGGALSDGQKAELDDLRIKAARVKDPNLSEAVSPKDLPLGVHPAYWLALRGYHPDEVAQMLAMRIFVLQGARDYQVTLAGDFPAWQKALAGKPNATLKVYPKLYHLFIEGEGPSTPQEYLVEGHVSDEVIEDIAQWVKNP